MEDRWESNQGYLGLEQEECVDIHRKHENHIFLVYMHINKINGKVYVGITYHANPIKRWGIKGQKYTHCHKLINAIEKYGWDNFEHLVLCRTTREKAILLEKTWIAYYKRHNGSYNITDGGDGADCISEENRRVTAERMRTNHPMKGKHHTPEARAKISEANKQRIYSEEHKEKLRKAGALGRKTMRDRGWMISEESRKKITEHLSKPVIQLDLNDNAIREFSSAIEADRFLSSGRGHHISDVCKGKRKTAYGFRWKYKEDTEINE